ncbi:YibE/F family protein [Candidatus Uhrbacteria bacterium]|jgi:uncharacterized membrane protein|nr:YibE/F family protein [Candidatus Uhrbacteria bacterium]
MKLTCHIVLIFAALFFFAGDVYAQSSTEITATINSIDLIEETSDGTHIIFTAVDGGGEVFIVDSAESMLGETRYDLKDGQRVLLQILTRSDGTTDVFLVDVVRTNILFWIIGLFSLLVVAIGRKRGVMSLIGLAITCLVLFGLIVPQILIGTDPVFITIIGSALILLVNLPLTHGFNKRTFYAYISTLIGLFFAWLFSTLFVHFASLSGLGSEETALLFLTTDAIELPSGLLLAGIILGAVGVLDDIAITQTETVSELHDANPSLSAKELYRKAMSVGKHHIASVVNTLVLAYAGVALPVFLLFALRDDMGLVRFLNEEIIAEELIRTVAGTGALILLVPISTLIATRLYTKVRRDNK